MHIIIEVPFFPLDPPYPEVPTLNTAVTISLPCHRVESLSIQSWPHMIKNGSTKRSSMSPLIYASKRQIMAYLLHMRLFATTAIHWMTQTHLPYISPTLNLLSVPSKHANVRFGTCHTLHNHIWECWTEILLHRQYTTLTSLLHGVSFSLSQDICN